MKRSKRLIGLNVAIVSVFFVVTFFGIHNTSSLAGGLGPSETASFQVTNSLPHDSSALPDNATRPADMTPRVWLAACRPIGNSCNRDSLCCSGFCDGLRLICVCCRKGRCVC